MYLSKSGSLFGALYNDTPSSYNSHLLTFYVLGDTRAIVTSVINGNNLANVCL